MTLFEILQDILTNVREAVEMVGGGPVGEAGITNGELAWDRCCNGSLYIVPTRIFPSRTFPLPDSSPQATFCGSLLVQEFAVVGLRCAPSSNNRGDAPPLTDIQASGQVMLADAIAIDRALQCWIGAYRDGDAVIRDTIWVGPAGGCVGSSTTVLLEIPD